MTVADLIAALSAFPPDAPVGVAAGDTALVPPTVTLAEVRGPHPGWAADTGLPAVGFEIGSRAALYHERRGGGLVMVVRVTGWCAGSAAVASAPG